MLLCNAIDLALLMFNFTPGAFKNKSAGHHRIRFVALHFRHYESFDIALPLCRPQIIEREVFDVSVMGRLRDGWSIHQAAAQVDALSPEIFQATAPVGYNAESTITRDGKHIVFTSTRNGDLDIFTTDADGSNVKQLTHELGYDGGPFWSYDGKKIVYRAENIIDANLVKNVLEHDDIPAFVSGQYLTGAMGELPPMSLVNVMVSEIDWERARVIAEKVDADLAEFRAAPDSDADFFSTEPA